MEKTNHVYKGAFALLIAGLLSKVISAFYRIPLQNLTGDIGFYIYQQVYPILGIAFIFALYGFPSAISKYFAEHQDERQNKTIYLHLFFMMMIFSIVACLAMLLLSPIWADWMGDQQIRKPLQQTGWVFLCVPFVALLRGRTQAYGKMEPTAYSQMIEQIIRAVIIIFVAILIYQGALSAYNIANGAIIASIVALSVSFFFLYIYQRKAIAPLVSYQTTSIRMHHLWRPVIVAGIVISLNHMLLLLMQLADAFTVVPGLLNYGLPLTEAAVTKGMFDRGQPLLQLVTIVGSSLAMAIVPQVTKINWQLDREATIAKIQLTMKYCVILSVGATVGLVILFPEINELLYKNTAGTLTLRVLSFSLLFSSLSVTTASILQGFSYMRWTAMILFIGLWIKIVMNQLLIPVIGINGGAIATVLTVMFICLANLFLVKYILEKERLFPFSWLRVLGASAIMGVWLFVLKMLIPIIDNRFFLLLFVTFSVITGLLIYLFCMIYFKVVKGKELECIPLPSKWKKGR